jgi:hypothetical protein
MAGAEKLSAPLRPVPGNYAEDRAERVLGFLTRWHSPKEALISGLRQWAKSPDFDSQ